MTDKTMDYLTAGEAPLAPRHGSFRSFEAAAQQVPPLAARARANADSALKLTLDALPQMIWMASAAGKLDFCNEAWLAFTGVARVLADQTAWTAWLHAEDRALAMQSWQVSLASGAPMAVQCRLRRHDGEYRWMRLDAVRRTGRTRACWLGTFTDIHDLKKAEQAETLVACEMAHRLRNVFAMFSGMLTLSSRSEPQAQAFASATQARLAALADAQDYLLSPDTAVFAPKAPASLLGLMRALLAPYQSAGAGHDIDIEGPDVLIGAKAAKLLGMVIHELATNALKHGALAGDAGTLRITTRLDGDSLALIWRETGGTPIAGAAIAGAAIAGAPTRRGFGTAMTDSAVRTSLGGTLERLWLPSGLVIKMRFSCARLAS